MIAVVVTALIDVSLILGVPVDLRAAFSQTLRRIVQPERRNSLVHGPEPQSVEMANGLNRNSKDGVAFRSYQAARGLFEPIIHWVVKQRVARGKDDPLRAREKLGRPTLDRPEGPLVWLHAVGLGEVLALRPLIEELQSLRPDLNALVTSTARSSANVFSSNLPPRTQHQFLPLDAPAFTRAFLNHWRPDLSVWSEQDLWPGMIADTARAGIPMAYVNVRMNAGSYAKRNRASGLYRDVLKRFSLISAQDPVSAGHVANLAHRTVDRIAYLKPAAQPLAVDEGELKRFRDAIAGRRVWVAASTHPPDEPAVMSAQSRLLEVDPDLLLILAPRQPDRRIDIAAALKNHGLSFRARGLDQVPAPETQVYLADSFGDLGLWYRLSECAFIGGSMGGGGGHNPWEAICLGVPVMAGPGTANFERDYHELAAQGLVKLIPEDAETVNAMVAAVRRSDNDDTSSRAETLVRAARDALKPLAEDLVSLIDEPK